MKKRTDVVIIGGGINGCLLAYLLANKGIDTLLLEKDYLASGATGRSQAGIRQNLLPLFATRPNILLAKRSVEMFSQLERGTGHDLGFKQEGSILLAHTKTELRLFNQVSQRLNQLGVSTQLITDPPEIGEIVPSLDLENLRISGGLYCPTDAQIDPFKLTHTYAELAKQEGAIIYPETEVTAIETQESQAVAVHTTLDRIKSDKIIIAAGAQTRELAKTAGVILPTFPERHEIAVTEPVKRFLEPIVFSPHDWIIFSQTGHGGIIGGWSGRTQKASNYNHNVNSTALGHYCERLSRYILGMSQLNVLRFWSGLFDIPIDFTPIVGETWIKNLFVNCGFAGHGITYAPALGELLTELITTGSTSNQDIMDSLSPKRFRSPKKYVEQTLWRFMDRIPDTTWEKMRSPLGKLMLRWGHLISKLM